MVDPEAESYPFVDRMGHFKRIRTIKESFKMNGNIEETMLCVKKIDKKAEIIKQSVTHQILSDFTAFICI